MRYAHIYHALHFQPWLILPAFHGSMSEVLDKHIAGLTGELKTFERKPEPVADIGDKIPGSSDFAPATVDSNGIATISINGIIAAGASAFEKSCYGGVSPEDISASLQSALHASDVRGIVLDINSPGGTVSGVPEAANEIAQAQQAGVKPVLAYTGDLMASAAYWLASGASGIYSTALATVGSIGVYVPVVDSSARARQLGYDVSVIRDGKHKGQGYPGTSLSDEARDMLQDSVNKIGRAFRSHILSHRSRVSMDSMQGQVFLGQDAAESGLVDGIVQGISDVKTRIG